MWTKKNTFSTRMGMNAFWYILLFILGYLFFYQVFQLNFMFLQMSSEQQAMVGSTSMITLPGSSTKFSECSGRSSRSSSRPPSALDEHSEVKSVLRLESACDVECSLLFSPDSESRPSLSFSERPSSALSLLSESAVSTPASTVLQSMLCATSPTPCDEASVVKCNLSTELVSCVRSKFKTMLPAARKVIANQQGFHLLLLSRKTLKSIQREIFVNEGNVSIFVHCSPILAN